MKKDGFDTLIDHSPEKLQFVKQSLLQFANSHLGNLSLKDMFNKKQLKTLAEIMKRFDQYCKFRLTFRQTRKISGQSGQRLL